MRCGGLTRRASIPRRTGGAGSSAPSITMSTNSSGGTPRRSAIGGPPWRPPCIRPLREGRRARAADPLRLGPSVHRGCLDQRGEVAGDDDHAVVRRGAPVQRVIERFMRTLKEQCLHLHRFQSLAEARRIIGEFIARYNTEWLIERLGHRTPTGARMALAA